MKKVIKRLIAVFVLVTIFSSSSLTVQAACSHSYVLYSSQLAHISSGSHTYGGGVCYYTTYGYIHIYKCQFCGNIMSYTDTVEFHSSCGGRG